ncbi:MAG: glutamine cyclotransferase [Gammaproteobacteria bacterium]|nr:MAG: glutamine cyclotransferase [Gammaproteobacteria bacterium]
MNARWLLCLLAAAGLAAAESPPWRLSPSIERQIARPERVFTQGLVFADGLLYESSGLYGRSALLVHRVGFDRLRPVARRPLAERYFGEGLAAVGSKLYQLTWREGEALVWRRADLEPAGRRRYLGEGWGLCYDGRRLVMSDGTPRLRFLDPADFAERGAVTVRRAGEPLGALNELECIAGYVWANVWRTPWVVVIDPADGRVRAEIDFSALVARHAGDPQADVLNGLAWDPQVHGLLVTGKNWPVLYQVRLRGPEAARALLPKGLWAGP